MSTRGRGLRDRVHGQVREDGRISIDPDDLAPPAVPEVAQETPEPEPAPTATPDPPPDAVAPDPAPRQRRKPVRPAAVSALDDPAVRPGRKDYRSFYVDDGPYSRFRAAMYWLARNPEVVAEMGDNMSTAVERWLDDTAGDLEKRFNGGRVFDAPPASRRRKPRE